MQNSEIKVCLTGALGKMGREVFRTCPHWSGIKIVSAVSPRHSGKNLKALLGEHAPDLIVAKDLLPELQQKKPDILLDLTTPEAALPYALTAIQNGVTPIIGTSGLKLEDFKKIEEACAQHPGFARVVPNFSIGSVLGMKFARLAAKWIPNFEITEIHHDQKKDAPSGTALETARLMSQARTRPSQVPGTEFHKVAGVRGGNYCDVPIHSIRLPGVLAQQSVLLGATGETLEIRHTVIDRSTYMAGVELAIRNAKLKPGLTIGLDDLISE